MIYELRNKKLQYLQAVELTVKFCETNELSLPQIGDTDRRTHCGIYFPRGRGGPHIFINPDRCRTAARNRRAWTWPGYTADLTVIGVLTHELGHHWHYVRGNSAWRPITAAFKREVAPYEVPVTSYGFTNIGEAIAESFKVFVTNPTLLLGVAPFHYAFFIRHGLRPVVDTHWRDVLSNSARHVQAAENKVARTRRTHGV